MDSVTYVETMISLVKLLSDQLLRLLQHVKEGDLRKLHKNLGIINRKFAELGKGSLQPLTSVTERLM